MIAYEVVSNDYSNCFFFYLLPAKNQTILKYLVRVIHTLLRARILFII